MHRHARKCRAPIQHHHATIRIVAPTSAPQSTTTQVAIAVGLLLFAAVTGVVALQEKRVTCTPAACETTTTWPASSTRQPLAGVRAVEVHEGTGKQRGVFTVSLRTGDSQWVRVHSGDAAHAAALKRELEELLAGQRQQLEIVTPPMYWLFAFVAVLLAFAVLQLRDALRSRGKYASR